MPAKVEVIDLGWNRIKKEIALMDGSYTKIGFPENGIVKQTSKSSKKKDHITEMSDMVTIASVHEFGAPNRNIPERSFLRSTYDENIAKIKDIQEKELNKIIAGRTTVNMSLSKLGEWFTAKVKRKIRDIKTPPNKPATIKRKGSSNPLIDTGQMIQTVTHKEFIK
jgi:hypothetical protein